MNLIDLPEYVYKYITWEKEYHKIILLKNVIFFSSARRLNDPFDSTVPWRYDVLNKEQQFELYIEHIRHDHPNLTEDEVKRVARNELRDNDIGCVSRIQNNTDVQREYIATKFGIFCVSKTYKSILMWSHYSNSHEGICIRFNCKRFREFIENECLKHKYIITWENVDYQHEYPILNPFEFTKLEDYVKPLLIKSIDWNYECEFRFILFDYPNEPIKIPDGIIDQIILGCRISDNNKNAIIKIAKDKNISLLQSSIKQDSFGLDFNEINV